MMQIELADRARIAHALEFIAAQLGEINERLARRDEAERQVELEKTKQRLADENAKMRAQFGTPRG
jgi:hypothetical protein